MITVIIPCYNEEEVLPLFYNKITEVLSEFDYELLFVDDGSRDNTLGIFREMAAADSRVKYISFSRNFGKESAMYAGLENAKGDYVVIIDADLQHPPDYIPKMYELVSSGEYDCATTKRLSRKGESKIRSMFAGLFYKIMDKFSQVHIEPSAQDFRFMNRNMVDSILAMGEKNRFSKGIFSWVGFRTAYLPYENIERAAGNTSWSFWKLLLYAAEGMVAFSVAPLLFSLFFGLVFIFGGIVGMFFDLLIGVIAVSTGFLLFFIGILGIYLSKIYTEVKSRPIYLSKEEKL
jgi:glycosyltransferase involved in cell wall biosynthesis